MTDTELSLISQAQTKLPNPNAVNYRQIYVPFFSLRNELATTPGKKPKMAVFEKKMLLGNLGFTWVFQRIEYFS